MNGLADFEHAMTESKRDKDRPAADRQVRLATALRANLRRRKEQARGREADVAAAGRGDSADGKTSS